MVRGVMAQSGYGLLAGEEPSGRLGSGFGAAITIR